MKVTVQALANYVNAATDLAEDIKSKIKENKPLDLDTVTKLNNFAKIAHKLANFTKELNKQTESIN